MLTLGALGFAAPWLLLGLAVLPVLWWLLRVTPPAPRRIRFPALRLLLGLVPREETPAKTPLWLILMRMALAALIILALAHPLLNPNARFAGKGPLVIAVDDGWSAADRWSERQTALTQLDLMPCRQQFVADVHTEVVAGFKIIDEIHAATQTPATDVDQLRLRRQTVRMQEVELQLADFVP